MQFLNTTASPSFPFYARCGARRNGLQSKKAAILISVSFPHFQPLPLSHARAPFSHPDWLFEIKWDGFRALLHSDKTVCG
jgi:ATP-dependent DNA ligase